MPKKKPKATGGGWKKSDRHIYFVASSPGVLAIAERVNKYLLIAVNELMTPREEEQFEDMLDAGAIVLLDSGVFSLTMKHARLYGVHMDEALKTPVRDLEGFEELYRRYVEVVKKYGRRVWGYIEIDAGGRDQKRRTRARLEKEGLRPIPVYHPLNDGWDYFDELATQYDRICCGNIVQASRYVRTRIVATLAERLQKYPHLWVHLLGLTPSELMNAYPIHSADSSSWLSAVRWSGYICRSALKSVGHLPKNYQYLLGDKSSWTEGVRMGAYGATFHQMNWQNHMRAVRQ